MQARDAAAFAIPRSLESAMTVDETAAAPAVSIGRAVAEHRAYLVRFARQRLQDAALVEDVVQDTIVAALQGAAQFEGKASARTWLTGILLRRIADVVRREARTPRAPFEAAQSEHPDAAPPDADATWHDAGGGAWIDPLDPQRLLESRQVIDRIESALGELPPLAARIVALREFDGLSNDETARRLGMEPAAVSLALHRARSTLRKALAAH
jgi:RNA polymerase sigma-70 factor (ECF subfamily)